MQSVLLCVIDGLRPDGLTQAETPTIDHLVAEGAHTLRGRTVMPSITLPCHASLFLGVRPERHGITTNLWTPQARPVPGLFEVVRAAGGKTASFYNWEPLRDLSRPNSLSAGIYLDNLNRSPAGAGDRELAEIASLWLLSHPVDFVFLYLGCTDVIAHDHGWMSAPYLAAISNADACLAHVLAILPPDVTVVVISDHGGHNQSHGTDQDEDLAIPMVFHGPDIPAGQEIEREVQITDIAPTLAHLVGLERPREWIGKPLFERTAIKKER